MVREETYGIDSSNSNRRHRMEEADGSSSMMIPPASSSSSSTTGGAGGFSSPIRRTPRTKRRGVSSMLNQNGRFMGSPQLSPPLSPAGLVSPSSSSGGTRQSRKINTRLKMISPISSSSTGMSSPSPRPRRPQRHLSTSQIMAPSLLTDASSALPYMDDDHNIDGKDEEDGTTTHRDDDDGDDIDDYMYGSNIDNRRRKNKISSTVIDDTTKRQKYDRSRMRKKLFLRTSTACGVVFLVSTFIMNSQMFSSNQLIDLFSSSSSSSGNINKNKDSDTKSNKNATAITTATTIRTRPISRNNNPIDESTLEQSSSPSSSIDILSIGSQTRLEYLIAQRDVMFSKQQQKGQKRHSSFYIRQFFNATEVDDFDPKCYSKLTKVIENTSKKNNNNTSLQDLTSFCRKGGGNRKGLRHDLVRRDFAKYFMPTAKNSKWFQAKQDKVGWICAQQRPLAGLQKLFNLYNFLDDSVSGNGIAENGNSMLPLPSYLLILDDDTFVDMDVLQEVITKHEIDNKIDSTNAVALTGCQTKLPSFYFPNGGFGLLLSQGLLRRLFKPMDLADSLSDRPVLNHMDERKHFRPGMNLIELFSAVANNNPIAKFSKWTFPGFCFHSDWVWGYIFKFYELATVHPLIFQGASKNSNESSDIDICTLVTPTCDSMSPICHNADPKVMFGLGVSR